MAKETNRIVTNILIILLVMEFLEVFHPKRKKSTRAAAADETYADDDGATKYY